MASCLTPSTWHCMHTLPPVAVENQMVTLMAGGGVGEGVADVLVRKGSFTAPYCQPIIS
eukprot:CAMPEP_0174741136 /NCGR_PEP_ID=MMETSP1094-20130205/75455_1 /TAXON_ID=156173 /ORGANISM="Chrysochromulina brevifilum, Strain UTEX LB 985" /LENGTH=58 /DNA_ID=CAMNT_0015944961 /DNA_START=561 /DNA_END=733 /DNA_ORIENTATION=-